MPRRPWTPGCKRYATTRAPIERGSRRRTCPLAVRDANAAAPTSRNACRAILARVTSLAALATELQSTWHREIPIAAAIDVRIESCAAGELVVRAPHAPNRNVHGTAFAGSLFSVCVLTGWGMTWLALQQRGLGGLIVVADSRIQYRKAVTGDIVCRCNVAPAALDEALASYTATGRAKLALTCTVDVDDKRAVTFDGDYVVHAKH